MARVAHKADKGTLFLLATCNFVVGSGAMVITGLIAPMAEDLGVTASSAAQLLTAYALAFAVSAPIVALLAARVCRKVLLVRALACFGALMVAAALAPGYAPQWALRAAAGAAAAAFVPNASAVAASLALPSERGRALTIVFGGFTAALVLGAPLGTYAGVAHGWRTVVGALGMTALALAGAAQLKLPGGIMVPGATRAAFRAAISQPRLTVLLIINGLSAFGSFVVFSLASVALPLLLGTTPSHAASALLVFGVGALAGNVLSVMWLDRVGSLRMTTGALLFTALALGVLALPAAALLAWGALVLWGAASFIGTTALQTRLLAAGPTLSSALLPMNSTAQFAGQSLGTAVGAQWLVLNPGAASGLAWIGCGALLLASSASWLHGRSAVASGASVEGPTAPG